MPGHAAPSPPSRSLPGRRTTGRATGAVLLLLVLVVGGGGYNYHRNWTLEKQMEDDRPYRGYAASELEMLRDAYREELRTMEARFDRARERRVRPERRDGSIAEQVDQFERTARTSSAIRDAAAEVAERRAQIEALDRELELRTRLGQGLARHWQRLVTI